MCSLRAGVTRRERDSSGFVGLSRGRRLAQDVQRLRRLARLDAEYASMIVARPANDAMFASNTFLLNAGRWSAVSWLCEGVVERL